MLERLDPRRTAFLLVDVQERLASAMPPDTLSRLITNAEVLLEASRVLGIAVVATEQYPKGLGPTVARLKERLASLGVSPIEKLTFDALGEPRVVAELARVEASSVIVAGMESHVCVFQTVRELRRRGTRVVVAMDAVSSRTEENRRAGLALAERCGAVTMPTESILFDLLERAGTEAFRALSKLIK